MSTLFTFTEFVYIFCLHFLFTFFVYFFRWALSTVPREFEDVVLTNLAGLLYKTGAIDEAITLMKDSLAINNKDPDSNFFMGNLYSAKVHT